MHSDVGSKAKNLDGDINMDHNLVLGFSAHWFNQLDQTNIKTNFFFQFFIALFIELGLFK